VQGGARAVIELEHYGVPFSRTEAGRNLPASIRRHDDALRQGIAQRTCAAADRTGHAMLHALISSRCATRRPLH